MITQAFDLNLIPDQDATVIHVDQYDTGTGRFVISLYDQDNPYSPSGTAIIQGTKPDGFGFVYSATITGNVVTADVTEQMTACAGDVRTQIVVTESTGRTGTFAFIMRVQKSALPDDTSLSESDLAFIEQGIEASQDAIDAASDSEAWAVGQRGGQDVPQTDPTYHNNSKYYSEVSDDNSEDSEAWAVGTRSGVPVSQSDPQYENNAKYYADHVSVSDMTNSVKGIGKPDTVTAEAANGVFSAIGTTIVATIDPNATPFSATWLKYNNETIVPDSRKQYRVTYSGETGLWYWTGTAYEKLAGGGGGGTGGHTILDSAGYPVTARANLRFDLMEVNDDPQNNATVVHSPIIEVPDQETWESMTPDPNQAYFLPWMQTGDMITYERTPIGTIIAFMGNSAPDDYLICDGREVLKSDYPKLAQFFIDQFNDVNYFGTPSSSSYFRLPNLNGEFLRGAGTNGHTNQGSGSTVGAHQDATEHPTSITNAWRYGVFTKNITTGSIPLQDSVISASGSNTISSDYIVETPNTNAGFYTSRPTNTSVLWCIKAKQDANIVTFAEIDDAECTSTNMWSAAKTKEAIKDVYSTTEQVVGTWIDSKPIYRKCFTYTLPSSIADGTHDYVLGNIANDNIESVIKMIGSLCASSSYHIVSMGTYHSPSLTNVDTMIMVEMEYGNLIARIVVSSGLGSRFAGGKICAFIEYTKTTD